MTFVSSFHGTGISIVLFPTESSPTESRPPTATVTVTVTVAVVVTVTVTETVTVTITVTVTVTVTVTITVTVCKRYADYFFLIALYVTSKETPFRRMVRDGVYERLFFELIQSERSSRRDSFISLGTRNSHS